MSKRLEFLKEKYFSKNTNSEQEYLFQEVLSLDPTKNFIYVDWILHCYFKNNLIIDNNNKENIKTILADFHKNKIFLGEKNIFGYKNIEELKNILGEVKENKTDRQKKVSYKNEVDKETEYLLKEEKGWKILIPKTKESSIFWGLGTKWCTSAKNNNEFDKYNCMAPLIIFISPKGIKYQYHATTRQFNNEKNETLHSTPINNYNQTLILSGELNENNIFDYISLYIRSKHKPLYALLKPQDKINKSEDYIKAITEYGLKISEIPKWNIFDKKIYEVSCQINGNNITYVPKQYLTKELCKTAILNGCLLSHIPNEYKDYDLCLESVKKNGENIKYITTRNITRQMFEQILTESIKNKNDIIKYFFINEKIKTFLTSNNEIMNNLIHISISQNEENIKHIPKEYVEKFQEIKNNKF